MAHFARIEDGIVREVHVINNEDCGGGGGGGWAGTANGTGGSGIIIVRVKV